MKKIGAAFVEVIVEEIAAKNRSLDYITRVKIQNISTKFKYGVKEFYWPSLKTSSSTDKKLEKIICPANKLIENINEEFKNELEKYQYIFVQSERAKDILTCLIDFDPTCFENDDRCKLIVFGEEEIF